MVPNRDGGGGAERVVVGRCPRQVQGQVRDSVERRWEQWEEARAPIWLGFPPTGLGPLGGRAGDKVRWRACGAVQCSACVCVGGGSWSWREMEPERDGT